MNIPCALLILTYNFQNFIHHNHHFLQTCSYKYFIATTVVHLYFLNYNSLFHKSLPFSKGFKVFSLNQWNCITTQPLTDACVGCILTWETYYLLIPIPSWSLVTEYHPVNLVPVSLRNCPEFFPGTFSNPPVDQCSFELWLAIFWTSFLLEL